MCIQHLCYFKAEQNNFKTQFIYFSWQNIKTQFIQIKIIQHMQGDDILVTVPHDLNESLDKHIVACIIVLCIKTTNIYFWKTKWERDWVFAGIELLKENKILN
jgi:uncharacterized membrane protein